MDEACYVFDPITSNRKAVFEKIIAKIPDNSRVLDLGSGTIGYYWSLGYAHKVRSISYWDRSEKFLGELRSEINSLAPEHLRAHFSGTIEFLKNSKIIPSLSYEKICENMISKIDDIQQFDFLTDRTEKEFDAVVCIESMECVNSKDELDVAAKNIAHILNPEGILLAFVLRYDAMDDRVRDSIKHTTDGLLNPTEDMLRKALQKHFSAIHIVREERTNLHNYSEALFIEAGKKP